jgi:hypothetical protein
VAKTKPHAAPPSEAAKKANELLDELVKRGSAFSHGKKLNDVSVGKTILSQDREMQAVLVSAALDRLENWETKVAAFGSRDRNTQEWSRIWTSRWSFVEMLRGLLRRALPLSEATLIRLFQWPMRSASGIEYQYNFYYPLSGMATAAESFAEGNEFSDSFRAVLESFIARLRGDSNDKDSRKVADRLQALLTGGPKINLEAGEAWSDVALADLRKMKAGASKSWNALLIHCQTGGRGKFTERWATEARLLMGAISFASFKEHVLRWFPLVDKPRTAALEPRDDSARHYWLDYTHLLLEQHVELLRGLVWCCGLQEDADLARALTRLALSAYRKLPGTGPRLVSLGNACVTALGMMPGLPAIGQLAILKTKVKSGSAQKEIEKAFTASAKREGLARDEIEELAVPSYGLESVGLRRETFDDYQAELLVDGTTASLHWLKDGKPLKSAPAAVKKDHAEEFKELQASIKDINSMLPAQRERLDTLFLARKNWSLVIWKERYLDHPLIGAIARRLIWSFAHKDRTSAGIWHGDRLVDANDKPLNLNDKTIVSLWHPIDQAMDDILAWREWLERREIVQPFKQAHREVYLLTDAERRTRNYSNRFAAHILRQHQFNALCAARGWKNQLRLMVDADYPPAHRLLPAWNLRAEYWIEGAGSNYGQDTNETGTYLDLSTDQVRFYRIDAEQLHAHAGGGGYRDWNDSADEPLLLETVPPLVFSEIMRDVDLFVGVASVGNDPNWADGGPTGQYRDYWQSYSFGELSATAQTRKALLERLLPRLKIAGRCTLAERFLIVRGSLRTYKIHLGSGNILMEPNDQYLCIVPKQTVAGGERVFLPFEGDGTLSIVLSKAFLLADDTKITDPTITSQLKN